MGSSDHQQPAWGRFAALAAATALLAACGGGGGGGDAPQPPNPGGGTAITPTALDQVQGFWSGPYEGSSNAEAIVLRNGETWLIVQSGGAVRAAGRAQGSVNATGVGATGVLTDLVAGTSQPLALQLSSVVVKSALTGSITAPAPAKPIAWTYNTRYESSVPLADFAGRWTSTAGGQRIAATWDIAAGGALTGTASTGCTYAGTLAAHAQSSSLATVALSETCAGRPAQAYSGIATLNESRSQASFVLGNAAGTEFTFVALFK